MQALNVTPEQVEAALSDVNGISSGGAFRNFTFVMPVNSASQMQTAADFNNPAGRHPQWLDHPARRCGENRHRL